MKKIIVITAHLDDNGKVDISWEMPEAGDVGSQREMAPSDGLNFLRNSLTRAFSHIQSDLGDKDVLLQTSPGINKISAIRALREVFCLGLREAKDLLECRLMCEGFRVRSSELGSRQRETLSSAGILIKNLG